jgi:hypothetical protein
MNKIKLLITILFVTINLVSAQTLRVPQDYLTIQEAIDAAQTFDTVLVSEGTYYENIRFGGKGIIVTSRYFITKDWQTVFNTVISGSNSLNKDTASTVIFYKEDSTAVLDGFTITGGTGTRHLGMQVVQEGAGIYLDSSAAIIRNNYIINNIITPQPGVNNGGGGGISSYFGNPTIYNNIIVSNTAGYAGGIVLNWSKGKIKNNLVYHNFATLQYGCGGIMVWQAPENGGIVENNTIIGNVATTATAGGISISVTDATTIPLIKNNIIWGNRQTIGKQITPGLEYLSYNDIEDIQNLLNITVYPEFLGNFILSDSSSCIDLGDVSLKYNDLSDSNFPENALFPSKGSIRNDLGVSGGSLAMVPPELNISDLYTSSKNLSFIGIAGQEKTSTIELLNLSTKKTIVDSIVHINISDFILTAEREISLDLICSDFITVTFKPLTAGSYLDTVKIYHQLDGLNNPIIISVNGHVLGSPTGVEEESILNKFTLNQNYPNPFNPSTKITYTISSESFVNLEIFDLLGRKLFDLVNEKQSAGEYNINFTASTLSSGIYFYKLSANNRVICKKMTLIK